VLKGDNRFGRLYAARALSKLGDTSGAVVVLNDLFTPNPVPFHYYAHDVGQALKDIGDPGTRESLEQLCGRVEGEQRGRVLNVIGQQADPAYVPFLAGLIDTGDRATQCEAALAISMLIYVMHKDVKTKALDMSNESQQALAKTILRWAFRDERPNADCGAFPDYGLLKSKSGAVVEIGKKRSFLYIVDEDSLRQLNTEVKEDRDLIAEARPRTKDAWANGSLFVMEHAGFIQVGLNLDYGAAFYLFRKRSDYWEPVCKTGAAIE